MDLRPLGRTGLMVSPIGLGTVKFGRNQGVKYPRPFDLPTDDQARDLLDLARSLGINLLDTAPAYGSAEQRLGNLLAGQRDDWILCTKVGESFRDGRSVFDFSPEATRAGVEGSLRRLRTDRLDVVLVHSDGRAELELDRIGTLDALDDLRARGMIRAFGVSTKTLAGAAAAIARCGVIMVTYNPVQTADRASILAAAALGGQGEEKGQRAGVGVLVKKALLSGHLDQSPGTTAGQRDPIQACMDFVLGEPNVSSVIVGTINPDHLRADARAAERTLRREPG